MNLNWTWTGGPVQGSTVPLDQTYGPVLDSLNFAENRTKLNFSITIRHISKDIKDCALFLLKNDYIPDDVAEILGVSTQSFSRWCNNLEVFSSVIPPPNPFCSCSGTLNPDMTHDLTTLIAEAPEMYLDEIQDWLALVHDVSLSKSALYKNIWDCGMSYKLLQKYTIERDEEARAQLKADMQANWVARQCIVVDETSKDDRTFASTLHSPTFSTGIRRTHWNPADLTGLQKYHILSHGGSARVRWNKIKLTEVQRRRSARFHWSPLDSIQLERDWNPLE